MTGGRKRIDQIINQPDRICLTALRVTQTWFRQGQFIAAMMYFVERCVGLIAFGREGGREDAPDPLQRNRTDTAVLAHYGDAVVTAANDNRQALAAATDGHDAARLHDGIQPALAHFAPRLRGSFE